MKRNLFLTTTLVVVALVGCSSFNNSFNTYHLPPATQLVTDTNPVTSDKDMTDEPTPTPAPTPAVTPAKSEKPSATLCSVSPWPPSGIPPAYPYQALLAAGGDLGQVERIERKHISELRAYISERRRMNREAMNDFQSKCTAVNKS